MLDMVSLTVPAVSQDAESVDMTRHEVPPGDAPVPPLLPRPLRVPLLPHRLHTKCLLVVPIPANTRLTHLLL